MTTTNRQVRTANRARLVMDGVTIGIAQSVSVDVSFQHQPVHRIGSPDPEEHVAGLASYRVSVGRALALTRDRISGDGKPLNRNGIEAMQGKVFDIVLIDDETHETLETIQQCSHDSGSIRYEAGRVLMQNCTFVGRTRTARD